MGAGQSIPLTPEQDEELKQKFGPDFTDEIKSEALEIFKNLDVSTDGRLNKKEFSASLGLMGTNNSILSNLLFDAIDTNRDEEIDFYEFLTFLLTVSVGTKEEKLNFGFKLIDLDKNGEITKEEIQTFVQNLFSVLTSFELKSPELGGYVRDLIGMLDFNDDGKITWQEYRDGCIKNESFIKNLGALHFTLLKPPKKTGKKVFLGQNKWDFMLSVMFGLQMSVERLAKIPTRDLKDDDYLAHDVFELPTTKQNQVQMVSYAPLVFRKLRDSFGLEEEDYISSLGITQVLGSFLMGDLGGLSELLSEGKSGSFFYFSSDLRFLVKTISVNEKRTFCRMLKNYANHMLDNKNTLLTRICGFYKLTIGDIKSRFIVMSNCFPPGVLVPTRFDLKGSTIGRTVGEANLDKPGVIYKDLDLIKMQTKFRIGHRHLEKLIAQMEKDSQFLEDNGIIDYSMLVGVRNLTDEKDKEKEKEKKENGEINQKEEEQDKDKDYDKPIPRDNMKNKPNSRKSRISTMFGKDAIINPLRERNTDGRMSERYMTLMREAAFARSKSIIGGSIFQSDEGGMYSEMMVNGRLQKLELYYVGIIDILIEYESGKQAEHRLKSIVFDGSKISVCPPNEYGPRFRAFMKKAFEEPSHPNTQE